MLTARIRLGLQIPSFNFPDVSAEHLFDRLAGIGAAAEASGFDSLFVMDHLHQIGMRFGQKTDWMLEGNTILAALAARTSKLNLGLMIGGVTYRNPAQLAKITTTLDVISSGRALLGIGAAWHDEEHRAYGVPFPPLRERFERLEEALQITRSMFTQEETAFEGRHYHVRNAINNPRPVRGDIPILVGGSGERKTLRLVAQYADASNVFGDAPRVRHLMGVLDSHCAAVGRDPAQITKTRLGSVIIASSHEEAQRRLDAVARSTGTPLERLRTTVYAGDPDAVAAHANDLLDAGLDGLVFNMPDVHDPESVVLLGATLAPLLSTKLKEKAHDQDCHPRHWKGRKVADGKAARCRA